MKVKDYRSGRKITFKLVSGDEIEATYNPGFMVNENVEYFDEFLASREDATGREITENAYKYIAGLLLTIGFEDDEDKPIAPTIENLRDVIGLDLVSMRRIHQAAFDDINSRANPTSGTGEESSSGSTQKES